MAHRAGSEGWTVRSFASGIEVTYAAGGASLTGENHTLRAVDDHLLPERQPNDIVDLILSKI